MGFPTSRQALNLSQSPRPREVLMWLVWWTIACLAMGYGAGRVVGFWLASVAQDFNGKINLSVQRQAFDD